MSEFYAHSRMADGHLNVCKPCVCARVRKHRAENDSVREYDRKRGHEPHRIAMRYAAAKRFRVENPEKYRAHTAVNNAVRDGRLVRGSCEVCGSTKVHAHHEDYAKPLQVRWLCALHHQRHHAETH